MTGVKRAPNTIVENAREDDVAAIVQLLEENRLPASGVTDRLETTLVARRNGHQLAGTAALEIYSRDVLLRSVAVAPECRGKGIGRDLTEAALRMAIERGVTTVYLLTTTAARFFPRFGFVEIAREEVPATVRASEEVTSACPASATVMRKVLVSGI